MPYKMTGESANFRYFSNKGLLFKPSELINLLEEQDKEGFCLITLSDGDAVFRKKEVKKLES